MLCLGLKGLGFAKDGGGFHTVGPLLGGFRNDHVGLHETQTPGHVSQVEFSAGGRVTTHIRVYMSAYHIYRATRVVLKIMGLFGYRLYAGTEYLGAQIWDPNFGYYSHCFVCTCLQLYL